MGHRAVEVEVGFTFLQRCMPSQYIEQSSKTGLIYFIFLNVMFSCKS